MGANGGRGSRTSTARLTVRGIATAPTSAAFIHSNVAAGQIATVTLPSRATAIGDTDRLVEPFGFATGAAKVAHYVGPKSTGDFVSGTASLIAS